MHGATRGGEGRGKVSARDERISARDECIDKIRLSASKCMSNC